MWAQQWGNIWDLVEPYKDAGSLDLSSTLQAHRDAQFKRLLADFKGSPTALEQAELSHQADLAVATKMTQRAEDFYRSLGMPALPATFYERRSEEHTSELQSLMRISYAVFCLKKKKK